MLEKKLHNRFLSRLRWRLFRRRRIAISSEGWHYLLVLAFIVGGASLREVNLLVALASMMIGVFLTNAVFAFTTPRRLEVRRHPPKHIFAGEPFTMEVSISNARRRVAVWTITIRDRLARAARPRSLAQATHVDSFVMRVNPQETQRASYRCMLPHRGRYSVGPLEISSGFPFGLVRGRRRVSGVDELVVYPRLGRLTPQWDQKMKSQLAGEDFAGQRRGWNDGDYYGIREWRSGDAQRWIHWRATARLNELAVRQFEQRDSRETVVLLDLWRGDRYGPEQQKVVERAVSFFATVISEACSQNAGRLLAGAAAEKHLVRLAAASPTLMWEWLQWLATHEPSRENQFPLVLAEMQRRTPPGAELVVISTRTEETLSALLEGPAREQMFQEGALREGAGREVVGEAALGSMADLASTTWIDCGGEQWKRYFQWR